MTNTYFAMFSNETVHTVAAKSVIFEVGHTCTPVSAWRGQTWGLKLEKKISPVTPRQCFVLT